MLVRASLHGERPLHPGLLVRVDGAVELVRAGLERRRDLRRLAVADGRTVDIDAVAVHADPVWQLRRVVHDDLDRACLRGELRGVELQRAAGVGRQVQRLARRCGLGRRGRRWRR